jgi:hypothetical protein
MRLHHAGRKGWPVLDGYIAGTSRNLALRLQSYLRTFGESSVSSTFDLIQPPYG